MYLELFATFFENASHISLRLILGVTPAHKIHKTDFVKAQSSISLWFALFLHLFFTQRNLLASYSFPTLLHPHKVEQPIFRGELLMVSEIPISNTPDMVLKPVVEIMVDKLPRPHLGTAGCKLITPRAHGCAPRWCRCV